MEGQSSGRAPPWTEKMEGAGVEGQCSSHTPPHPPWTERMEGAGGGGTRLQERDIRPSRPPPFSNKRRNPGPDTRHSWEGQLEGNGGRGEGGEGTPPPHA